MALKKKTYINGQTVISAENLNDIQDEIIGTKTANGTVVSQNADFAEVAEWEDGNPNNEDRTGYFVCANVPLNGIVMKKATSLDDVKGVSILAPAFAGNYTADKLDSEGNLLPKYSFVAVLGFVPVIDNGTCTVGGRCMPDDNGCAIPSSNSMGYQVVNRIDENRVLIIIEPNGDMVQRIKTRVNELQEDINGKADIPKNYELIETVTLTEDVASITKNTEPNGTKYNFDKICLFIKAKQVAKNAIAINWLINGAYASGVGYGLDSRWTACSIMECVCDKQFNKQRVHLSNHTNSWFNSNYNEVDFVIKDSTARPIRSIELYPNDNTILLPTGTTIEIWGVRA